MVAPRELFFFIIVLILLGMADAFFHLATRHESENVALAAQTGVISFVQEGAVIWGLLIIRWVLLVLGIFYFIVPPAISLKEGIVRGAFYGFILYGFAIGWMDARRVFFGAKGLLLEICWGIILVSILSAIVFYLQKIRRG